MLATKNLEYPKKEQRKGHLSLCFAPLCLCPLRFFFSVLRRRKAVMAHPESGPPHLIPERGKGHLSLCFAPLRLCPLRFFFSVLRRREAVMAHPESGPTHLIPEGEKGILAFALRLCVFALCVSSSQCLASSMPWPYGKIGRNHSRMGKGASQPLLCVFASLPFAFLLLTASRCTYGKTRRMEGDAGTCPAGQLPESRALHNQFLLRVAVETCWPLPSPSRMLPAPRVYPAE